MTITITPERAAWEGRGITDPVVMLRLAQIGIDVDTFDGYLDASVDSIAEMYRLKNARILPELANAYRMEAPVSVEEMVLLNNASVSPKLLKALLAQFPGSSIDALAQKKGGIGKTMLNLLTNKLGVTDPDVMAKIAKRYAATELSAFIALGATIDDIWVDGEVARPNSFFLTLRKAGHPELFEFFEYRPSYYDESPAKLQKLITFALEARDLSHSSEFVAKWYQYEIDVPTAASFHARGFDYSHYALMEDLGKRIGRTDFVHMAEVAFEYPGMITLLNARAGNGKVESDANMVDTTILDHFREDFEGTAKAVRNVISRSPAVRSFQSGQELYRGMTGYDAAVWQSDILGEVFGDLTYAVGSGYFSHKDYAPSFHSWESLGAERLKVRNPPDPDLIRRQMASGIRSGVNAKTYFQLVKLGVPKREMASIARQAEAMDLSGITREMVGLPALEEDEGFAQATSRPEFDWDDDITIEEGP